MSSYLLIFTGTFHAKNAAKKYYNRRFRASKVAKFSTLPNMMKEVIRKFVNFIYMCPFFFTMSLPFESWVGSPV